MATAYTRDGISYDGFGKYWKREWTYARREKKSFVCETPEGPLEGKAGDYLAIDSQGFPFPLSAQDLASFYEPIYESL